MFGLNKIRERWQTATGVPMILAGIAIVKPAGYGDALFALINRYRTEPAIEWATMVRT